MMTAETQVHEQVAEVSANSKPSLEIQGDQCALDVSSYQDLPKLPVPDCNANGISHRDNNGIARDDAEDNSYVFVSGNDDLIPTDNNLKGNAQVSGDLEGVEVQNGEFLSSSASGVDSSWVFQGTEVASSNNYSVDKSGADALSVAVTGDAVQQNGRVGSVDSLAEQHGDHQNDPRSSLAAEENQEPEVGVLESIAGSVDNVQSEIALDITESIDTNDKSEENNCESTSEVGDGQELKHASLESTLSKSSEVGILESGADSVGNPEPDISLDTVESIDVNQESQEKNNFESTSVLGEGGESQHANLEPAQCKSSRVGVSESFDIALDDVESIDVNKKTQEENLESTSESGEGGESQNAGLEVTSSGSSEVKVSKLNEAEQNSESSVESGGIQDSQIMHSDSAVHESPQTEVQKVNTEEQSDIESTGIVPVMSPEQSESHHDDNLDNDGEKLEAQTETQLPSDAKDKQETITELENVIVPVAIPEQSESHHDDNLHDDGKKLEEETKTQLPSDAKENRETITENGIILVTIPEQSESHHDVDIDNDGEKLEEQTKTQLSSNGENGIIPKTIPEQSESHHDDNLGNDGEKLEDETKTQLPSDANENQKTISDHDENDIIPVTIPEQSESYHDHNLYNDGQKLDEQTKKELSSDAKENQETVTVLAENGGCLVDLEHKIENSMNEVELPLGTETGCSAVLDEIKFPVSSVNDSVPETNASVEHIDDSERSLELQRSAESTGSLTPVADSDIGQRPVESDENVHVIAREHEAEDKASPCIENIAANTHEIIKPETGNADNVAVGSVENVLDFTREHGTEHVSSCLTENDAANAKEVNEEETEVENPEGAVSFPVSNSKFKTITVKDVNDTSIAEADSTSCSTNKVITSMEFELETRDPEVATFQVNGIHLKTEVSIVDAESADLQSMPSGAEKEFEVGSCSVIGSRDMYCNDVSSGNDVSDSSVTKDKLPNCVLENVDIESKGEQLSGAHLISDIKLISQETKDVENSLSNSKSVASLGNSSAGAMAGQDVVVEILTRPFHFLIRMPRFEDLKMKEQIRKAQLLVEEKTQHRDAFRIEVQKYKANCLGYAAEYEAAVSESRALKRSVKAKRAEIDSLQSVINKVKNAISVEDIDTRIHSMEHMIEHETLPLKEEKLLIREIKQLKQLREQLSSNIGSQDEVQQALNDRDQIEERLKVLKKELDCLKESVFKADAVARALEKKYEDENKKVKEVQTQYSAANNVRQDAYAHLQSLRKQLFEKNQQFRMYKENVAAASNYAAKRDREALHRLCINQVESVMQLWNKNDEFRKDYVRCNMKSTVRRLGTLDGRSLGPDEQPPVLTGYGDERVDVLVSNPANSGPVLQTQILEQEVVKHVQEVTVREKTKVKELEEKNLTTRPRKQEKPVLGNGLVTVSGREITDKIREEQHVLTEEELGLARKVEELRKEEDEAKLKEQRRLEERAKALEALERKKKNAEKAQMRAELRAQKEAEQKEKEREKKLRKKERKKGTATEVPDCNNLVETTPYCESWTETIKEPEIKENPPAAAPKRTQKPSQFTKQSKAKSIPPPLRNRSRRKIQQWVWIILTCLLVVALFLLGNVGLFSNLSNLRRRNSGI